MSQKKIKIDEIKVIVQLKRKYSGHKGRINNF
jgi:hypothetical protein